MNVRHIIWDFDGTLMDTYPCIIEAFLVSLRQEGIACSEESVSRQLRVSVKDTMEYFIREHALTAAFYKNYQAISVQLEPVYAKPFAGICELCHLLYQAGVNQYIFTHRDHDSTVQLLKQHQMHHFFKEYITSNSGFARKPKPDAIYYLIDKYKMNPSEVIMIGDRELDLLSGIAAGVHTGFYGDPKFLSAVTPDFIWDDWKLAKTDIMT